MDVHEVMAFLRAAASEQTRKTYLRHDAGEDTLGVSMANIEALRKRIKKNHVIASALWTTGVMESRYLAATIADPAGMSRADLNFWRSSIASRTVLDAFVRHVAGRSGHAQSLMAEWIDSPQDLTAEAGWMLFAVLVREGESLTEASLQSYLTRIELEIHTAPNRTRYAMNSALIAIGVGSAGLREAALSAAARIGKVEVDHGDTNCKTPDAAQYIRKGVERQSKKAKSAPA